MISSLKVLDSGIYSINNFDGKIPDCPFGGIGMLIVSKVNNDYIIQLSANDLLLSYRYVNNGQWSDWSNVSLTK